MSTQSSFVVDDDDTGPVEPEPYQSVQFASGTLKMVVKRAENVQVKSMLGGASKPSPFVRVVYGGADFKTNTVKNSDSPTYEAETEFPVRVSRLRHLTFSPRTRLTPLLPLPPPDRTQAPCQSR